MTKIEFGGLKTSTSFNFKNKKAEGKYWDYVLIESALRFKNEFSKFLREKLHVIFSWHIIFKILSIIMLIPLWIAFINGNLFIGMADSFLALSFGFISLIYYFKFRSFVITVAVTEEINSVEFLEELRNIVLTEKPKK